MENISGIFSQKKPNIFNLTWAKYFDTGYMHCMLAMLKQYKTTMTTFLPLCWVSEFVITIKIIHILFYLNSEDAVWFEGSHLIPDPLELDPRLVQHGAGIAHPGHSEEPIVYRGIEVKLHPLEPTVHPKLIA